MTAICFPPHLYTDLFLTHLLTRRSSPRNSILQDDRRSPRPRRCRSRMLERGRAGEELRISGLANHIVDSCCLEQNFIPNKTMLVLTCNPSSFSSNKSFTYLYTLSFLLHTRSYLFISPSATPFLQPPNYIALSYNLASFPSVSVKTAY